jgi:hypothetical protein
VSFVFLPIVLIWIMLLAIEKRVPVRYRSDVESIGKEFDEKIEED